MAKQLRSLFRHRNALVAAEQTVVAKRDKVTGQIEAARKTLTQLRKHPRRNRAQIAALKKVIPALGTQRKGLNTRRGELITDLNQLQGAGSSHARMPRLPALGVLGGDILGVQLRLRDLGAKKPTVTDTPDVPGAPETGVADTARADLLQQALKDANLRTAVSEAHYTVLSGLPHAGIFHTGGIVPGPTGQERSAVVQAGEGVFTPGQMAAMGGGGVKVVVNGDIVQAAGDTRDPVELVIGDRRFTAAVEKANRGTARRAGRGLPSRGGI